MSEQPKPTVFVDSDAFIAFIKKDDTNHKSAAQLYLRLKRRQVVFLTSNYVFAEVVTVLSYRLGQQVALAFIEQLRNNSHAIDIRMGDEQIFDLATDIFKRQASKNVSFTDCTNMAFLVCEGLDAIFSFDGIYKKNGFKTVKDL